MTEEQGPCGYQADSSTGSAELKVTKRNRTRREEKEEKQGGEEGES
jgi:hypothetical protein